MDKEGFDVAERYPDGDLGQYVIHNSLTVWTSRATGSPLAEG
jgi:hypothetical protein